MKYRNLRVVLGMLAAGATAALVGCSGDNGSSCHVTTNATDGTATIACDDGTTAVVHNGMDGVACTVRMNADGSKTIACDDGTTVTVNDGDTGPAGDMGGPGAIGAAGDPGDPGRNSLVVGPGIDAEITAVTIPADRRPVVSVTLTDTAGHPLDRTGTYTVGPVSMSFLIAYLQSAGGVVGQYNNYITNEVASVPPGTTATQPASENTGEWTEVDPTLGTYTYRFMHEVPAGYDVTKTHTVGAQASRVYDGVTYVANPLFNFRPDGMAVTETRDVVTTAGCNNCHDTLAIHGGGRREIGLCILCHTTGMGDPESGNTIDFKVMVHKIHMGADLPSVRGDATATPPVAGVPYRIVGYRASVHDYSTVVFPQDVNNCAKCHTGADGGRWLTSPTRAICSTCHDRTSFVSPAPAGMILHSGGARADDSACTTCHTSGATDASPGIAGAHWGVNRDPARTRVELTITSVTGTGPTETPVVNFHVNVDGAARDIIATPLTRLTVTFSGPTTDPTGYQQFRMQGSTGAVGVVTAGAAAGDFVYTPPAGTTMTTIATACGTTPTGSFAVGLEGYIQAAAAGSPRYAAFNPVVYVGVTDTTAVPRRHSVDIDQCNNCHDELALHGGSRRNTDYCVLCHTANLDANNTPAAGSTVLSTSARFSHMVHRIHTGEDGANPYRIRNTVLDEARFPGDRRDCETCHVAGGYDLPLPDLLPSRTSVRDSTGARLTNYYQGATAAACTGCHDADDAVAHTESMTTALGAEACAVCHEAGAAFGIDTVHSRAGL